LLSFLIAFAALYFLYKQSSSLDLHTIWDRIRAAKRGILILAFGVYYTTFIFRSLRWQVLLTNVGYSRAAGVPVPSVFGLGEILYISWFANCVTPARLGDAYRGYLLKRAAKVSFTVTMGTILAERLIDITVLAAMMAASTLVAFQGKLPPEAERALAGGVILAAVGLVGLVSLRRLRPLVAWVLPARFLDHYIGFENGVVGSFKRVPLLVTYSLIGWLIEGLTLFLTAQSLGAHLSLVGAIVVALVASLLTTVPFTPAGLGVTEAGMILVLTRLGLDVNTAGAVALLNRVINYWSIIVFGFILYLFSRKK
jgi:glycosyltransferase 2 family protein